MADNSRARDTQARHTAGDWFVTTDRSSPHELVIDAVVNGVTVHIALVHIVPGPDEVTLANAAVMAAAPELLAAARAALAYHEAIASCANDPERMASFCTAEGDDLDALYMAWHSASTSAVAKAEGRTP